MNDIYNSLISEMMCTEEYGGGRGYAAEAAASSRLHHTLV